MAVKLYENLKTYQQATVIYDFTPLDKVLPYFKFNNNYLTGFTVKFTEKYIKSLRTREQMNQAARSGQQNIAEGSTIGKTSKKSEIKLRQIASRKMSFWKKAVLAKVYIKIA